MIKNDKIRFVLKVTVAHIVTYIICGIFFSSVMNYRDLWQSGVFGSNMRDYDSVFIYLGPAFQFIRGFLFGGILLLIPNELYRQKHSWVKLWIIIAGIGIINTPGPSIGSIEGMIYTTVPLNAYTGTLEIFTQTLWFSWWVCRQKKENNKSLKSRYLYSLIAAIISVVGISVSGVIIAVLSGADFKGGAQDPGALPLLLLSAVTVFLITAWYQKKPSTRLIVFLLACYMMNGVHTYFYNIFTESRFSSPLTFFTSLVLTILIWLLVRPKRMR